LKIIDIAKDFRINPRKLTRYALNPDSPHGKHKAVIFDKLLGFTKDNYTELIRQIETGILQAEINFHSEDDFGRRYTADITVQGTEDRRAVVRTGWLVSHEMKEAHLVTLYVKK
jgi:hypothetical protein